jgi:hypothetical protein
MPMNDDEATEDIFGLHACQAQKAAIIIIIMTMIITYPQLCAVNHCIVTYHCLTMGYRRATERP